MSEPITAHVFPFFDDWKVRKTGSKRALRSFKGKQEAIRFARGIADRIYVHGKDGLVDQLIEITIKGKPKPNGTNQTQPLRPYRNRHE